MLGRPRNPRMRHAVAMLRAWVRSGGHRLDRDHDGTYEHSEAVSILDRWWPKWMRAEFRPTHGRGAVPAAPRASSRTTTTRTCDGEHHGSAYQTGWYGYAQKDLRRLLGRRVRGPLSRVYCGGSKSRQGTRRKCQSRLRASLKRALKQDPGVFYKDKTCEDYEMPSSQWCYDAVRQRPVGAINQPLIHWINRPTFQQVVEVPEEGAALAARSTSRPRAGSRRLSRARGSPRAARGCGRPGPSRSHWSASRQPSSSRRPSCDQAIPSTSPWKSCRGLGRPPAARSSTRVGRRTTAAALVPDGCSASSRARRPGSGIVRTT